MGHIMECIFLEGFERRNPYNHFCRFPEEDGEWQYANELWTAPLAWIEGQDSDIKKCYAVIGVYPDSNPNVSPRYHIYLEKYYDEDEFWSDEYDTWLRVNSPEGNPALMWIFDVKEFVREPYCSFETYEQAAEFVENYIQRN